MADTQLRCKCIDIRYKAKNGIIIGIYSTEAENLPETFREGKNPNQVIRFSAKGNDLPTTKKFEILLYGTLSARPIFGLNLTVNHSEIVKPTNEEGIINYLCEFVEGVGLVTAKKLYAEFGKDTLKILEESPKKILKIKGIRRKTAKKAISSFEDIKAKATPKGVKANG